MFIGLASNQVSQRPAHRFMQINEVAMSDEQIELICKKIDDITARLSAIRRYDANTALLAMVLWGIGLPLVFFVSVIYAARHGYQ
jgi:hypothetical protein